MMLLTNSKIEMLLSQLEAYLERTDIIGYAAARNTRLLQDAAVEYLNKRDELVMKHGTERLNEDGNATGDFSLSIESEGFPAFLEELEPFAKVEQDVPLVKLRYEQAIGLLSGTELLELDWMFEEE